MKNNKSSRTIEQSRKKVLIIGALPPPTGGMETVMEQMSTMRFKNFDIVCMNVAKSALIKSNIVFNSANFIYRCIKLPTIIILQKPELVHTHVSTEYGFWQKAMYANIAKLFGKKTVLHLHGADFKEFYSMSSPKIRKKISSVLNSADALITLSESWKKYYSSISSNKNIFILKNAVENVKEKFKRIYPRTQFTVLFLSRICQRKGAYDLLKAISMLKSPKYSHVYKNTKFVFVGPFEDRQEFYRQLIRYRIQDKVIVVGEVLGKSRFRFYSSSDIFILPSYAEGLPVAIIEAMSYSLPVISTKVGAIPEVIKHENGILIKPADINAIKDSIIRFHDDKDYRKSVSANNKELSREYSIDNFKDGLKKIYEVMI